MAAPPLSCARRLGLCPGDALAAPTHWYYGGLEQIRGDYGLLGITNYTKPRMHLTGSIMSKSNTNGGGRGTWGVKTGRNVVGEVRAAPVRPAPAPTLVAQVINHGKLPYWEPGKDFHYHCVCVIVLR
jgi:hypothetical protein